MKRKNYLALLMAAMFAVTSVAPAAYAKADTLDSGVATLEEVDGDFGVAAEDEEATEGTVVDSDHPYVITLPEGEQYQKAVGIKVKATVKEENNGSLYAYFAAKEGENYVPKKGVGYGPMIAYVPSMGLPEAEEIQVGDDKSFEMTYTADSWSDVAIGTLCGSIEIQPDDIVFIDKDGNDVNAEEPTLEEGVVDSDHPYAITLPEGEQYQKAVGVKVKATVKEEYNGSLYAYIAVKEGENYVPKKGVGYGPMAGYAPTMGLPEAEEIQFADDGSFEMTYAADQWKDIAIGTLCGSIQIQPDQVVFIDKDGNDVTQKDDPGKDDPGKDDPGKDDPGKDDPGKDDPGKDDPGKDDPGKDDPGAEDPGKTDPKTDEPVARISGNGNMYAIYPNENLTDEMKQKLAKIEVDVKVTESPIQGTYGVGIFSWPDANDTSKWVCHDVKASKASILNMFNLKDAESNPDKYVSEDGKFTLTLTDIDKDTEYRVWAWFNGSADITAVRYLDADGNQLAVKAPEQKSDDPNKDGDTGTTPKKDDNTTKTPSTGTDNKSGSAAKTGSTGKAAKTGDATNPNALIYGGAMLAAAGVMVEAMKKRKDNDSAE